MKIVENVSLQPYNTFGIEVKAAFFCEVNTIEELMEVYSLKEYPDKFIISGGSNMLLTKNINALVIKLDIKGISIAEETETTITIKVMAGENWHQLVLWTLEHNYGGLENLSLIPGNVGTSPIQNIGAYGVELKDVFVKCEALNLITMQIDTFTKEACNFGYRESFFKNDGKGKYVITAVFLSLKKAPHTVHTSYGVIEDELKKELITSPTIQDVSKAVIAIRKKKLPDPKELGNSGSFFKNPIITAEEFDVFMQQFPDAPYYKVSDTEYKIPAGWLIEQAGFKGKRFGDAGVHKNQALVLVNYGSASGEDILKLSQIIQSEVLTMFGITITPEVNIIK